MKSWHPALLLLSIGATAACGGDDPPPVVPPPPPAETAPPPPPPTVAVKADNGTEGTVGIAPDIQAACGISAPEALFAFNSATVRKGDAPVLDKLAVCFTSGPLAGKRMRIVGHADPRGEDSYNLALGERRGNGVRTYLNNAGLKPEQSEVTSRGEMDALGTDDASWAKDRRVNIMLAE